MKKLGCAFVVFVFLLACASSGFAQSHTTTGTVQGDVLDERGGSVAGATVEVRNLDTNFTQTEKTNSDGHFAFLSLAPGRYQPTISQPGFASVLQQNVNLTVGQAITIPVTMKISSVSQQIVVTDVPVIETTKTENSATLDELAVADTPVLGRKFEDLLTLTPGGSLGGPIIKNKLFFFAASEGIREDLSRKNLSAALGPACSVATPVAGVDDVAINASPECQRVALLNFFKTAPFPSGIKNTDEGVPVDHSVRNASVFGRVDYNLNSKNQIFGSYNFDWSKNSNQTFDVAKYGTSANGIEGPSKIQAVSTNWFSTLSNSMLNEAHFTYAREARPRLAVNGSSVPDTAMGFATNFRFGQPFFLEPAVDELFYPTAIPDNFSAL